MINNMKNKLLIAYNIQFLRNSRNMTQQELGDKLNYSDKAVSKWERGDSVPDIFVLKTIAELFGVSLDYFFEEHSPNEVRESALEHQNKEGRRHFIITAISVVGLWLAAIAAYIIVNIVADVPLMKIIFYISIPASMIILLIFNGIWGKRKYNVYIISGLIWTILLAFVLCFIKINSNIWMLLFIGIPAEIIAILSCKLGILSWKNIKKKVKK